ncbi:hypothetical protein GCM10010358_69940 [Streptomyces minutiscleroticus]|uniref:Uncharacterized protein n=1 Tax=Streptomyces minutiscleroticus TaxID=68238 RepID=A0A918U8B4_9ACTN|nr:hypothetical protein GCM10010358_69940 [Streptomyces minutiscleroticus]
MELTADAAAGITGDRARGYGRHAPALTCDSISCRSCPAACGPYVIRALSTRRGRTREPVPFLAPAGRVRIVGEKVAHMFGGWVRITDHARWDRGFPVKHLLVQEDEDGVEQLWGRWAGVEGCSSTRSRRHGRSSPSADTAPTVS